MATLVLTNGRNMMLICPLVIAATIFHRGSSGVRSALAVCALSTLAVLIIFLGSGDLARWLPDDFSTLNGRIPLWVESTDLIAQRPFVGVGYFASRNYLLDYFDFAGHAHNSYVEAALTTGMIGFGLMMITLIYATIITIRTRDTLLFGILLLCCLGSMVNPLILLPNVTTFVFTLVLLNWLCRPMPHNREKTLLKPLERN